MTEELRFEAADQDGQRVDRFLTSRLSGVSRAEIQRWIREDRVTVGGKPVRPSYRLLAGDEVHLLRPAPALQGALPEAIPLDIAYEDDDLLVVDKPAGMVVHPAPGHHSGTLVNALLGRLPQLALVGGPERSGIVHRLDRDTSGLIVVAKTTTAFEAMQAQFKGRTVAKAYCALVEGEVGPMEGSITAPLGRDPVHRKRMAVLPIGRGGRSALTYFKVMGFFEPRVSSRHQRFTLLELDLHTGRTHQIRVHLAFIKHPVVGDRVYGRRKQQIACPRQFLHAARLQFAHPISGASMTLEASLPSDLCQVLDALVKVEA